jgi:hypothetical protein
MHPYVTDSKERIKVPLYIAGASTVIVWLVAAIMLPLPWWMHAPFVLAVYAVISIIFDRQLWRWKFLRENGLVSLPDLNGVWSGHIVSSFDGFNRKIPVRMRIVQNWRTIHITLSTEKSQSHSVLAGIMLGNSGSPTLSYEYANEPQGEALYAMQMHVGRARLSLGKEHNKDVLSGDYYSGGERHTYGNIDLERTDSVLSTHLSEDTDSLTETPSSFGTIKTHSLGT